MPKFSKADTGFQTGISPDIESLGEKDSEFIVVAECYAYFRGPFEKFDRILFWYFRFQTYSFFWALSSEIKVEKNMLPIARNFRLRLSSSAHERQ